MFSGGRGRKCHKKRFSKKLRVGNFFAKIRGIKKSEKKWRE